MADFDTADIRRYYDRQTPSFVALGQGGGEGAIHRAVWAPGVRTRAEAFHYVEDEIARHLRDRTNGAYVPHVVDLGCGVGGSLIYLATRLPLRGTGITLSGVQATIASARIQARGLADRLTCVEGDYARLPAGVEPADLAFAIESFVHGPSPEQFFSECRRVLRPGGSLILCDDFLRPSRDARAERIVDRFRRGWRVNTLIEPGRLRQLAADAGFAHEATADLSPWLELGRPRDRAIAVFVALAGWLPLERTRVAHVVGGSALQTCLARGWIGYDLVRFRRER